MWVHKFDKTLGTGCLELAHFASCLLYLNKVYFEKNYWRKCFEEGQEFRGQGRRFGEWVAVSDGVGEGERWGLPALGENLALPLIPLRASASQWGFGQGHWLLSPSVLNATMRVVDLFPTVPSWADRPWLLAVLRPKTSSAICCFLVVRPDAPAACWHQASLAGKARHLWSLWVAWRVNTSLPGPCQRSSSFSTYDKHLSQGGQGIFKCRKIVPICQCSHCRKSLFQRLLLEVDAIQPPIHPFLHSFIHSTNI